MGQARHWCTSNPAAAETIRACLPSVRQETKHFAAMPYAGLPALVDELLDLGTPTARAMLLLIATAARTSEVLGADWSEIDLATRTWEIPASRMKGGRSHQVPLNAIALEAIGSPATGLVFPGVGIGAMGRLLTRLRPGCTPHGFRSGFADWATERTQTPAEVIEGCLAHLTGSRVSRAYTRTNQLDQRRVLMERWASYLGQKGRPSMNVLAFKSNPSTI